MVGCFAVELYRTISSPYFIPSAKTLFQNLVTLTVPGVRTRMYLSEGDRATCHPGTESDVCFRQEYQDYVGCKYQLTAQTNLGNEEVYSHPELETQVWCRPVWEEPQTQGSFFPPPPVLVAPASRGVL